MRPLRLFVSLAVLLPLAAAGQSVISNTILVPLYYLTIPSGESKLGIYASLGGGTPNIFEFDTGGWGFYAAYATNNNSPWWGIGFDTTGNFVTNTSFIQNGAIGSGTTWMDYNTVSIDWALASGDPTLPGYNYINVNTLEVVATTVPEPGTWAIGALLLGGLAARVYRRRQAAAQS